MLLHLYRLRAFNEAYEVPAAMGQDGVAAGVGVRRSHASIVLKALREKGLAEERMAHTRGGRRRRKVYSLTFTGRSEAKRIMDGLEAGGVPIDRVLATGPAGTPGPRGGIPQIKYFFGREEELATLGRWLTDGGGRVLVVQGIPGMGKTTFLARATADAAAGGSRSVFWHTARDWSGLTSLLQPLAAFLSERSVPSLSRVLSASGNRPPDIDQVAAALLESGDLLLVIDDVQNADDKTVQLLQALTQREAASGLRVAVAGRSIPPFFSRRDATVGGRVHEMTLEGLGPDDGRMLYEAVVDGGDFDRVYAMSKGHPLSIELMGLTGGSFAESHRFILEEIHRHLNEEERTVLGAAAVHRLPVPAEALFIQEGVTYRAIDDLAHRGLLRATADRLQVHDLIRDFVLERQPPDDRRALHSRAAGFYLEEGGDPSWLEAHYHLIRAGEGARSLALLMTRASELLRKGYHEELLHIAGELAGRGGDMGDRIVDVLKVRAEILNMYGEVEGSREACLELVRRSEAAGDVRSLVQGRILLGAIAYGREEWDEALGQYRRALTAAEGAGDTENMAKVMNNLGILHWRMGDVSEALRCYDRSLTMAEEMGDRPGIARIHANLGIIHWENGDRDAALASYDKALTISEDLGDMRTAAILFCNIGEVYAAMEEAERAREAFERAIELAEAVGMRPQAEEARRHLEGLGRGN